MNTDERRIIVSLRQIMPPIEWLEEKWRKLFRLILIPSVDDIQSKFPVIIFFTELFLCLISFTLSIYPKVPT